MRIINNRSAPGMHCGEVPHKVRQQMVIEELDAFGEVVYYLLAVLEDHGCALEGWHVDEEEVAGAGGIEVLHEAEVAIHARWEAF